MSKALPDFSLDTLRILDVIRSRSYGASDVQFQGDEAIEFEDKCSALQAMYARLQVEYI